MLCCCIWGPNFATISATVRQREEDCRAAEHLAAQREERHQAHFAAPLAATQPNKITMVSYVVSSALRTKSGLLPSFSVTGD